MPYLFRVHTYIKNCIYLFIYFLGAAQVTNVNIGDNHTTNQKQTKTFSRRSCIGRLGERKLQPAPFPVHQPGSQPAT